MQGLTASSKKLEHGCKGDPLKKPFRGDKAKKAILERGCRRICAGYASFFRSRFGDGLASETVSLRRLSAQGT